MSVRNNLIAARALIDTPEKWGKGEEIGSAGRKDIYLALCWDKFSAPSCEALRAECVKIVGHDRLFHFNDHPDTAHTDIMDLFDRAIEAAGDK